jgi:hypothetical protein
MPDAPPGPLACAYCEEHPAVLSHLWASEAWDREPLCLACQALVLADPDMPRLTDEEEEEEEDTPHA